MSAPLKCMDFIATKCCESSFFVPLVQWTTATSQRTVWCNHTLAGMTHWKSSMASHLENVVVVHRQDYRVNQPERTPFQPTRNLGWLYSHPKKAPKEALPLKISQKKNVATILISSLVLILWRISLRKLGSPTQLPPTDHLTHKALRGVQEIVCCQLLAETCHKKTKPVERSPSYIYIYILLRYMGTVTI